MTAAKLVASLPFPIRVEPSPYTVEESGTRWTLTVERVQREHPDERVAGPGTTADLERDRAGHLAYGRVTGEADLPPDADPVDRFVAALNAFIAHVRDVLGVYWIRPLEPVDLHRVTVDMDGRRSALHSFGRSGGITLPVAGLTAESDGALRAALARDVAPPVWRQMQLDAREALDQARYEESVVLAWSSLEAACRQALPGMAYRAGLSALDLAARLKAPGLTKRPPFSHEEAVERVSGGKHVVLAAAELTSPRIFHPGSVAASVDVVYDLRSIILHQGVRVSPGQAADAHEAVEFVLRQALALRDVPPPPATLSWQARFGGVLPRVAAFAASKGVRLVLAHPDDSFFRMRRLGRDLWVRVAADMSQEVAAVLVEAEWDSWEGCARPDRPRLHANPPGDILLSGLVRRIAGRVESSVCFAEALIAASRSDPQVPVAAEYGASRLAAAVAAWPPLDPNDEQGVTAPVQLAQFLAALPQGRRDDAIKPLRTTHPDLAVRALAWAEVMAAMDPVDDHARCAVYRAIHAECLWLDTILVECPVEGAAFGSRRRALPASA